MADFMSEESIFKFKNAFAAFESKNTGLIKVKQLGGVMRWATTKCEILVKYFWNLFRYLGQNPSEAELQVSWPLPLSSSDGRASYICRTHNAKQFDILQKVLQAESFHTFHYVVTTVQQKCQVYLESYVWVENFLVFAKRGKQGGEMFRFEGHQGILFPI